MLDYICAILIRLVNVIFHILPIEFTLWLGRQCGNIAYLFNISRRAVAYANMRAAFSKDKTPAELNTLVRDAYKNLVTIIFEIMSMTKLNPKYFKKYIEMVYYNREELVEATKHKGGIFLTAHFGNWELCAAISLLIDFPLTILAREQKMKRVNELINKLRESTGQTVVRKGITTRYILEALKNGKMIGMMGDQNAGKSGLLIDFFGRPASSAPGTMRIAQKTGVSIFPAFIVRKKGPYHTVTVEKPMRINKTEDIKPYIEKYNRLLEGYILRNPDHWLWFHKRWKATPLRKVVVLSDGKQGHLNQSLAIANLLRKYRVDSGYSHQDTEITVIEVRFKSNLRKALLKICSLFSSRYCQGCMKCLKFSLTKDSYENLMKHYADIIISSGSGIASVNRYFSIENNAKSCVIMKPSLMSLSRFSLAIIPWHDVKGAVGKNTVVVDTVPNLVDSDYLNKSSQEVSKLARLEGKRKIGVLIGGDNADFELTPEIAREAVGNVLDAANKMDTDILFTTSRRTSKDSEILIKDLLQNEKRCKFLVIANEKNIPYTTGGILGLSDVVVVSCESASMISEAIASGKKVIVFTTKDKKTHTSKFRRMLRHLEDKGYISVVRPEELSDCLCRSFTHEGPRNIPDDMEKTCKGFYRIS